MKLLSGNNQDAAHQGQNDGGYQGVVTLDLNGFEANWLACSGVLHESIASNRCSTTRMSFSQISWTNWHSGVDSQPLSVNSISSAVREGFFGLPATWPWSSPSSDISIARLDAHRVFGIDSLDLSPTERYGFGWINDGQAFVKEDYLRSSVGQVAQEGNACGDKNELNTGSNRAGVPNTDIQSQNKEIESSKSNQAGCRSVDRRVALDGHVAIVSQKADN